ncbi:hypothetical protein LLH00_06210 [bacterium]|nr:hypothetical protein [bacterium]
MRVPISRLSGALLLLCLALPAAAPAFELPLTAREANGLTRRSEPVSTGVFIPRGALKSTDRLAVISPEGKPVAGQFEALAFWPDKSIKWLLVDFLADCQPRGKVTYSLRDSGEKAKPSALVLQRTDRGVTVSTGPLRCELSRERFDLFENVFLDHDRNGSFEPGERVSRAAHGPAISLTDSRAGLVSSGFGRVKSFAVEAEGPVRATLAVKGSLADLDGKAELDYTARLNFYAGTGFVRVFFTLVNRNPTEPVTDANGDKHWIMGRPGSVFMEDMSLNSALAFDGPIQFSVGDGTNELLDRVILTDRAGIYQESSGGENWYCRNHMNAKGEIPLTFRGAKVFVGRVESCTRNRPQAWIHLADRRWGIAVAVRNFWQNFPKALTATPEGDVRVGLWPEEFPDLHELQGGEIKTHEVAFFFQTGPQGSNPNENRIATVMAAFQDPLVVRAPAESYLAGGFFDDAVPEDTSLFPTYEALLQGGVAARDNNLFQDIERYDEYDWRNWGDTPARNEYDETGGPHTGRHVMSHFNHEYDHGFGMLLQNLRTLDSSPELSRQWWSLAEPGLWHEADIDVYHCSADSQAQGAFNGGKFAHTSHGVEVANASHRGSPLLTWWGKLTWPWGQGQSPESGHFNTRGQMALYYLTGNRQLLEAATEQADLVYYKITQNVFPQIDQVERDPGNNLQILTDAYLLTWDKKYIAAAEKILESTGPAKQWYTTEKGRRANPDKAVSGFWTAAICINAAARWTAVMEEATGKPYKLGRDYVVQYADFTAICLAGGPEHGFYADWSPSAGGHGDLGPWTYRLSDVVMFGHKYSDDPQVKQRCLKAAEEAFEFMSRRNPGPGPSYNDSKSHTILSGGGREYTYFKKNGRW